MSFEKDLQFRKFQLYGFLKNLRFFEPFLMLFFLEKGITFLEIGTLYALREITRNLTEIPSGMLADIWGRRRTLASSFAFYIISFIIFYFTEQYHFFVIAMIFFAVGDAFRTGTNKAMIFEYLKINDWEDHKVAYYGLTRGASQTGSAISSLLAAGIVFWSGNYSIIFILSTIPYILDFFLILSYPKILDGEKTDKNLKDIMNLSKSVLKDFINFFRNADSFRRISCVSIYSGFYKASKDYLQPLIKAAVVSWSILTFLEDKQKAAILIGIIYFFIYLLNTYSSRHSGRFHERINNYRKALMITMIFGLSAGIAAGLLHQSNIKILAIIPFLFIFMAENFRKPIGIAFISENMKNNILASSLSAESQISSIIAGIIALLLGFFADHLNPGLSITIVSGILLVITISIFGRKDKTKP